MSEELGTRDVVEQLDTRLGNLEQGQRALRVELPPPAHEELCRMARQPAWTIGRRWTRALDGE